MVEDKKTEDVELDIALMTVIGSKIHNTINLILEENNDKDIGLELINVITYIASQLAIVFGASKKEYLNASSDYYDLSEEVLSEVEKDKDTYKALLKINSKNGSFNMN